MKARLPNLTKLLHVIEFAGFYLFEVVASNLRVARDVLLPSGRMKPAIIKVNVSGLTDRQLLIMTNLVTMTPGTLSLDVVDGNCLLIHSLYVEDPAVVASDLEKQFIKRIRNVF